MRKPCILIVENVTEYLAVQVRKLRKIGWEIVAARTFEEGLAEARRHNLDLALVDRRLGFEWDEVDNLGIRLCQQLPRETLRVLVSGHPTTAEEIARLTSERIIDHYQNKLDVPAQRRGEIARLLEERVATNFGLEVAFHDHPETEQDWSSLANAVEEPCPSADEVSFLFHRLVPKSIGLAHLWPVEGGAGGTGIARVRARHRATGLKEQVIVKFGARASVEQEAERFEEFVAPLGPRGIAPLRWRASTARLSAIAYWLVRPAQDAAPPSLAEYLRLPSSSAVDADHLITVLFSNICRPWYEAYLDGASGADAVKHPSTTSLRRHYLSTLWSDRNEVQAREKVQRIKQWLCDRHLIEPKHEGWCRCQQLGEGVEVVDPSTYVLREDRDEKWPSLIPFCVTHGDLHPRNIFVVGSDPCVIDFADCGWGHPFRDFATLEVGMRFGVLYDYADPRRIWGLEQQLMGSQLHPVRYGRLEPDLERVAALTARVREESTRLLHHVEDWQRQYAVALLFYLLKVAGLRRVTGLESEANVESRRLLAYLSAGAVAGTIGIY